MTIADSLTPACARWVARVLALVGSMVLAACATAPADVSAPPVLPLQEYLQQAGKAAAEGNKERARGLYRLAAKTYPAAKQPWLKLTEDYFEVEEYGQSILASQEVLRRDPADSLATSVLAVSGLRVASAALSSWRQQRTLLRGGMRIEAEGMAATLRDLLGEPAVVAPRPVVSAPVPEPISPKTPPRSIAPPRPSKPVPAAKPAATPAAPVAKPAPSPFPSSKSPPVQQAPAPADNPFSVLKK